MPLPYEKAKTGKAAVEEMHKILRAFGAESFGHLENFQKGEVTVQFVYRGIPVSITASSKGYAAAWLRAHPWRPNNGPRVAYERRALERGQIAVWSILRDWIKGQVTAVECGILSFQGAFLGQILLKSGETVLQRVEREPDFLALPAPEAAP